MCRGAAPRIWQVTRADEEAGGSVFIAFADRAAAQTALQKGRVMCARAAEPSYLSAGSRSFFVA